MDDFKTLTAIFSDGSRFLWRVVPIDFDTQAWANRQAENFKLLQIVRIVEDERGFCNENC